jgi:hypothetical protein
VDSTRKKGEFTRKKGEFTRKKGELGPDDRRNQLIFNRFSAAAPLKTREKLLKTRAPVDSFRAGGSTKRGLKTAPPRGGE